MPIVIDCVRFRQSLTGVKFHIRTHPSSKIIRNDVFANDFSDVGFHTNLACPPLGRTTVQHAKATPLAGHVPRLSLGTSKGKSIRARLLSPLARAEMHIAKIAIS